MGIAALNPSYALARFFRPDATPYDSGSARRASEARMLETARVRYTPLLLNHSDLGIP